MSTEQPISELRRKRQAPRFSRQFINARFEPVVASVRGSKLYQILQIHQSHQGIPDSETPIMCQICGRDRATVSRPEECPPQFQGFVDELLAKCDKNRTHYRTSNGPPIPCRGVTQNTRKAWANMVDGGRAILKNGVWHLDDLPILTVDDAGQAVWECVRLCCAYAKPAQVQSYLTKK